MWLKTPANEMCHLSHPLKLHLSCLHLKVKVSWAGGRWLVVLEFRRWCVISVFPSLASTQLRSSKGGTPLQHHQSLPSSADLEPLAGSARSEITTLKNDTHIGQSVSIPVMGSATQPVKIVVLKLCQIDLIMSSGLSQPHIYNKPCIKT